MSMCNLRHECGHERSSMVVQGIGSLVQSRCRQSLSGGAPVVSLKRRGTHLDPSYNTYSERLC